MQKASPPWILTIFPPFRFIYKLFSVFKQLNKFGLLQVIGTLDLEALKWFVCRSHKNKRLLRSWANLLVSKAVLIDRCFKKDSGIWDDIRCLETHSKDLLRKIEPKRHPCISPFTKALASYIFILKQAFTTGSWASYFGGKTEVTDITRAADEAAKLLASGRVPADVPILCTKCYTDPWLCLFLVKSFLRKGFYEFYGLFDPTSYCSFMGLQYYKLLIVLGGGRIFSQGSASRWAILGKIGTALEEMSMYS